MDRKLLFLVTFLVFASTVYALTPEDKAYIEQSNQKTVAQISSKIDTQVTRIEQNYQNQFDKEKEEVMEEISDEVKGHLKAITVGLSGIMIIILCVFKIVDLKLSHTRNIKKYENELKDKIKITQKLQQELILYKQQLDSYRQSLVSFSGESPLKTPISLAESQKNLLSQAPKPKKRFNIFSRLTATHVVIIVTGSVVVMFLSAVMMMLYMVIK